MGKTKVIAIEGIDGSGKSVQYNKLAEALTDMGYSVEKLSLIHISEPTRRS